MSFIAKSLLSYFSSNKNQNKSNKNNSNKNTNNQIQNLFRTKKTIKDSKIFSVIEKEQKTGIISFFNKKENNEINNGSQRKILPNGNFYKKYDYNKYKDSSLGINFNGIGYMKSDNQNCIFMSITALPEYSYSSSEELRLADLEKLSTGNISFYKIKNTSVNKNIVSEDNNNLNENGLNCDNSLTYYFLNSK